MINSNLSRRIACGARVLLAAASLAVATLSAPNLAAAAPADPPLSEVVKSLRPNGPLPRPGNMPDGTWMKKIQERGRLVVGVPLGIYLFGYLNSFTNQPEGFDVDIARQVARAIFGDDKHIEFKAVVSASRIPMVNDGSVDMVVATMTINAARKEQVYFSEVYFDAGQRLLVGTTTNIKGIEEMSGKKVCAPVGSTSIKNIPLKNPRVIVVPAEDYTDCLVLFQKGEVEGISSDDVILAGLAKQDPYAKVVGEKFTAEPYGIAISKQHPEFVRFVNGVLTQIKNDGTWAALYEKWLGGMIGATPAAPKGTYEQ